MPKKKVVAPKRKYIATVMEITHGGFFRNNKHYAVKVIEADENFKTEIIEEAAMQSAKLAKGGLGMKIRFLATEEVDITTMEEIRATGKAFRAFKEAIKK